VVLAVLAVVALAAATWLVLVRQASDRAPSATTGAATTEASPTPTTAPPPVATAEPGPGATTMRATAAAALSGFLAEAAAADQALHGASARINAAITATEVTYDQTTVDLLARAAPEVVAPTLPAGMPAALQQAALLVYSDLVSRWAAMDACRFGVGTFPLDPSYLCFVNGGAAAARFDADVAALERLAQATPEFAVESPDSQAAEELAVRAHYIAMSNRGCAGSGGVLATDPIPVVWQSAPSEVGGADVQGTVNGIPFRGTYDATTGWQVEIFAC
jgi:hypothetical protein